eukprot:COSAG06_NODE_1302_length_9933_cov_7.954342_9_plen_180_part_00
MTSEKKTVVACSLLSAFPTICPEPVLVNRVNDHDLNLEKVEESRRQLGVTGMLGGREAGLGAPHVQLLHRLADRHLAASARREVFERRLVRLEQLRLVQEVAERERLQRDALLARRLQQKQNTKRVVLLLVCNLLLRLCPEPVLANIRLFRLSNGTTTTSGMPAWQKTGNNNNFLIIIS